MCNHHPSFTSRSVRASGFSFFSRSWDTPPPQRSRSVLRCHCVCSGIDACESQKGDRKLRRSLGFLYHRWGKPSSTSATRPAQTSQDPRPGSKCRARRPREVDPAHRSRALISFPKEEIQRVPLQGSKPYPEAAGCKGWVCRDPHSRRTRGWTAALGLGKGSRENPQGSGLTRELRCPT